MTPDAIAINILVDLVILLSFWWLWDLPLAILSVVILEVICYFLHVGFWSHP